MEKGLGIGRAGDWCREAAYTRSGTYVCSTTDKEEDEQRWLRENQYSPTGLTAWTGGGGHTGSRRERKMGSVSKTFSGNYPWHIELQGFLAKFFFSVFLYGLSHGWVLSIGAKWVFHILPDKPDLFGWICWVVRVEWETLYLRQPIRTLLSAGNKVGQNSNEGNLIVRAILWTRLFNSPK